MNYAINISSLNLECDVVPSKSVVHRQLIIAFLSDTLKDKSDTNMISQIIEAASSDNDDIRATKACLKALYEADKEPENKDILMPCKESGSTLRFMLSVGTAYLNYMGLSQSKRLVFLPEGRLIDRPQDQLIDCLAGRGIKVEINKEEGKITAYGTLTKGTFEIQGNISSQYISGLIMALILLPDYSVHLQGPLESKGYFELTINTLEKKHFKVLEKDKVFSLKPERLEKADHQTVQAEGDWSSAAFLLCLGALAEKSRVKLGNLDKNSSQKDKVVIDILDELGIHTRWEDACAVLEEDCFRDHKQESRKTLQLDASDYPDIVPYIAVVAAAYAKETRISNIDRLRYKECDRVKATIDALAAAGVDAVEQNSVLIIKGKNQSEIRCDTISIQTFSDHRIAMMACLIAAWTKKTVFIDNKDCVNKSFPRLFELLDESKKA
ncbi:MAG: hypothetical protein K5930_11210 [Treponemataceae bacterium]|nr:hypothetical protein [Treponemataceae bacterium]